MAAQVERSLHFIAHACSRERVLTAFFGCIALITVAIGALGLQRDSWLREMLETCINIHVLFGLLLCGLVFARCRWCVGHSARMLPTDIRGLSRHLSRVVYLMLYVVIGVSQVTGILSSLGHGGAVDFNLFDEGFRNGRGYDGFNPKDDFQLFFASGLCALIFVRVLAFRLWQRSVERVGRSKPTAGAKSAPTSRNLENSD